MAYKYKLKEFEVGDVKVADGVKSTVTDIDSNTGAISWSIQQIPNIDKLVEDVDELTSTAKKVYQKTKDDKKFLDIYEQARSLRNVIRTHVRNNYPDDYKKAMRENLNEETFEDEIERLKDIMYVDADNPNQILVYPLDKPDARRPSQNYIVIKGNNVMAVQGYNSGPIADFAVEYGMSYKDSSYDMGKENASGQASLLSSNVLKDAIEAIKDSRDLEAKKQRDYYAEKPDTGRIGYGLSSQPRMNEKIADVDEMSMSGGAGAYQTPYAFRLPKKKKKKVKEGATKSANIHKQGQHPGEDLGPGPKATEDGVKDNAYVKQFKYQLVPKNKNGTYVQKGSGLEVKKLF